MNRINVIKKIKQGVDEYIDILEQWEDSHCDTLYEEMQRREKDIADICNTYIEDVSRYGY